MNWWPVYGIAVSTSCAASVAYMAHALRTMRKTVDAMHAALTHVTIAASNMWDTLTPEQIRTLHPYTVEVGNGVPSWDEIREAMHNE